MQYGSQFFIPTEIDRHELQMSRCFHGTSLTEHRVELRPVKCHVQQEHIRVADTIHHPVLGLDMVSLVHLIEHVSEVSCVYLPIVKRLVQGARVDSLVMLVTKMEDVHEEVVCIDSFLVCVILVQMVDQELVLLMLRKTDQMFEEALDHIPLNDRNS